jgi:hypothetical protein
MSIGHKMPRAMPGQSILATFNLLAAQVERALNITTTPPLEVSRTAGGTNIRLNGTVGSGNSGGSGDTIFAYITTNIGQPIAEGDYIRYSWQELVWQGQTWAFNGTKTGTLNAFEINNRPVRPGTNVILFPTDDGDYIFEAPTETGVVRVLSATPDGGSGMFRAYVSAFLDGSPPSWEDGASCWAWGPNDGSLIANHYVATPMGIHAADGLTIYVVSGTVVDGGCVSGQTTIFYG